MKDILAALVVLTEGGTVVLHDMNPRVENRQFERTHANVSTLAWNGGIIFLFI
jgi:hypothetical protein